VIQRSHTFGQSSQPLRCIYSAHIQWAVSLWAVVLNQSLQIFHVNWLSLCIVRCAQWPFWHLQTPKSDFVLPHVVAVGINNGIPDGLSSDSLVCMPTSLTIIIENQHDLANRHLCSIFGNIFPCLFMHICDRQIGAHFLHLAISSHLCFCTFVTIVQEPHHSLLSNGDQCEDIYITQIIRPQIGALECTYTNRYIKMGPINPAVTGLPSKRLSVFGQSRGSNTKGGEAARDESKKFEVAPNNECWFGLSLRWGQIFQIQP